MNPEDEPDFQYVRDIAEGSFGRVCLFRRRDNTYCAGKIVYRDRFRSSEPYEREYAGVCKFRELGIKSPLLLEIIHVRRKPNEDEFCYMMELADDARPESSGDWEGYVAKTLRWELQNSGQRRRLPPTECIARILLVAEGLEILHNAGLIHRDVKPANIIYVGGVPKLADIGLVADSKKEKTKISATPAYEAPEGPISKRSDIYSLGMMLYELVTGRSPSQFPSRPDDIEAWTDRDQVLAILKVVYRSCAPNPRDRYATVAKMRWDLESIQKEKLIPPRFGSTRTYSKIIASIVACVLIAGVGKLLLSRSHKNHDSLARSFFRNSLVTAPSDITVLPESLTQGLVLHYDFAVEPVDGRIVDLSEKRNDGQVFGVAWVPTGHRSGGMLFGSTNSYIRIPNNGSLNPSQITLAAWIKTSLESATWRRIFDKCGESGYDLNIGGEWKGRSFRGKVGLEIGTAWAGGLGASVADGKWHHVVGTFNGVRLRMYVDGQPTGPGTRRQEGLVANAYDLTLGQNCSNPLPDEKSAGFDGQMDDVMMFDRPLSPDEVQTLFKLQSSVADIARSH